jgi:hypothetical protein
MLFLMMLAFGAIAGCGISEKNPYTFIYTDDGVRYYSYCVDDRCTVVPESEVPDGLRNER